MDEEELATEQGSLGASVAGVRTGLGKGTDTEEGMWLEACSRNSWSAGHQE